MVWGDSAVHVDFVCSRRLWVELPSWRGRDAL